LALLQAVLAELYWDVLSLYNGRLRGSDHGFALLEHRLTKLDKLLLHEESTFSAYLSARGRSSGRVSDSNIWSVAFAICSHCPFIRSDNLFAFLSFKNHMTRDFNASSPGRFFLKPPFSAPYSAGLILSTSVLRSRTVLAQAARSNRLARNSLRSSLRNGSIDSRRLSNAASEFAWSRTCSRTSGASFSVAAPPLRLTIFFLKLAFKVSGFFK